MGFRLRRACVCIPVKLSQQRLHSQTTYWALLYISRQSRGHFLIRSNSHRGIEPSFSHAWPLTHSSTYLPNVSSLREELLWGCIQKFPVYPPGARTANVKFSTSRYSCIAILWVSLVSFAAITLCVASERVIQKVSVHFVMTQSGNFWIHPRILGFVGSRPW
jgi:hypothetical protein